MSGGLGGARVGILEGRMTSQLAELVRRHGGEPRVAPALRERPIDAGGAVSELIDRLSRGEIAIVVFMTGVGAAALFDAADRAGRLGELVERLQGTTNVSRGQKPWRPLKERGVPIAVTAPSPYTSAEVWRTLETLPLAGAGVALVHYGERDDMLADALAAAGSDLFEIQLYEWTLPEDTGPLEALVDDAIAGRLDAVVFTTRVQVRHLMEVARARQREAELVAALNERCTVAAVGPTSAAALEAVGVAVQVEPTNPKMGPMVIALAEHFAGRRS